MFTIGISGPLDGGIEVAFDVEGLGRRFAIQPAAAFTVSPAVLKALSPAVLKVFLTSSIRSSGGTTVAGGLSAGSACDEVSRSSKGLPTYLVLCLCPTLTRSFACPSPPEPSPSGPTKRPE